MVRENVEIIVFVRVDVDNCEGVESGNVWQYSEHLKEVFNVLTGRKSIISN
jgi:hypothetical protein